MQITSAKKSNSGFIINSSLNVPNDISNSDYQALQKWITSGGVLEDQFTLAEIKSNKIAEIKSVRDFKNLEPILDTSAEILNTDDESTGQFTFFVFHTTRHPVNPAADPTVILTNAIVTNQPIPYSTVSLSGQKVTVKITPSLAKTIVAHLALRNNNNYKLANAIIEAINAASTKEAVDTITWSVEYL